MEWDIFISHASEDKESVARPLTRLLQELGLKVWLDANELTLGDNLSKKIDEGLAHSSYGVVILSEYFFQKQWPRDELAGLATRQLVDARKVILPVWHGVDQSFIVRYSPPLAGALAVSTKDGLEKVAAEIMHAVCSPSVVRPIRTSSPASVPMMAKHKWWIIACSLMLLVASAAILYPDILRNNARKHTNNTLGYDSNKPLFWRSNHEPISGYVVVSCNNCGRPRALAFYHPGSKDGSLEISPAFDSIIRNTTVWPTVPFLYPEDKPHVSSCVDFPAHVCPEDKYSTRLIWRPRHAVPKSKDPTLRLELRCPISGFEVGVFNESGVPAQGINVDVMAWQIRAPGAELIKSYTVHDLGPWADATIFNVFDDSLERRRSEQNTSLK